MKLQARSLSFSYIKSVPVLQNISFALEEGELLSVLGPNGAGKSTLFRCILGLLTGYTGEILLNGIDLHTLSPGPWPISRSFTRRFLGIRRWIRC